MENTIQNQLLEVIGTMQGIRDKLPEGCRIHIDQSTGSVGVWIFTEGDHAVGLKIKRLLGIEDAKKDVYDPEDPRHTLSSTFGKDIFVTISCKGLPPTCRIEHYEEEIPKSEVVMSAETIKVKRSRILCGSGEGK